MKSGTFNIDGLRHVKEARLLPDLTEISLTERLLDDDVEKGVHNGVILHLCLRDVLAADVLLRSRINNHCVLNVTELDIDSDSLLEVGCGEDVAAGLDVEAEDGISLLLAGLEDTLHDVGV